MDLLLVDGYNMIGAWPDLKRLKPVDFAAARDLLIEKMAEYQAVTGIHVIIVFDAHAVPGRGTKERHYRVDVIYTKENETADECIEKLAIELRDVQTQVYVATSDATEQWATFGQGALRKSARDLLAEVNRLERRMAKELDRHRHQRQTGNIRIPDHIAEVFEKWRRDSI